MYWLPHTRSFRECVRFSLVDPAWCQIKLAIGISKYYTRLHSTVIVDHWTWKEVSCWSCHCVHSTYSTTTCCFVIDFCTVSIHTQLDYIKHTHPRLTTSPTSPTLTTTVGTLPFMPTHPPLHAWFFNHCRSLTLHYCIQSKSWYLVLQLWEVIHINV